MNIPSYLYNSKISGIYCIENSINHKRYIGSSNFVYGRLHKHNSLLLKNQHENVLLQNAVNKYGINSFECYLIELVINEEELTYKEQYWIDLLNPEYNLTYNVIRNKLSKESCEKISKTLLDKYSKGEIKPTKTSPIDVYDLNGNYIKSFTTIRECSRELNIHVSSIIRVLKGIYSQAKNYQFKYSHDSKIMLKITRSKIDTQFKKKLTLNSVNSGEAYEGNPDPSLMNDIKVVKKEQRLIGEESTNNPNTSAEQL